MRNSRSSTNQRRALAAICCAAVFVSCGGEKKNIEATQTIVERWADQLDGMTDETGVYTRWDGETLSENDAWGHPLHVAYSQGGMAEEVAVRSLGPDGQSNTEDDIVAKRFSANLKGIGRGIKENIEETTQKGAKGLVAGIQDGIDELRKRKEDEAGSPPENATKNTSETVAVTNK